MADLALKTKISVLWIFMAVAMSAHVALGVLEPGGIEQIMSEETQAEMTAGMLLLMAIFWLVPLIMAFLSVNLKDTANRWANLILGLVFIVFNVIHFAWCPGMAPSVHQVLIVGSTIVVAVLIFWYALRWRPQKA